MANTIDEVLPKLLAQGLLALRENAVMPRLVNRSLENLASQKGNVINVPIPSAITARSVTPSVTQNSNQDFTPTVAVVTLDFWREATFQLSDTDVVSVMDGTIPMQASEAIKALGNAVDSYILGKHTGIFSSAGVSGTTPFSGTLTVAVSARENLNRQLAPQQDRRVVVEPSAESNLLLNSNLLQAEQLGDASGIRNADIGRILGMDWFMDQNVPSFTPGAGWVTGFALAATVSGLKGETTLSILNTTSSGAVKVGDLFTIGGVTGENYRVAAAFTASITTVHAITIDPALRQSHASGVVITVVEAAYPVNLAFHRDAFAWASRPLQSIQGLGNLIQSAVDPVSGIALRLEVSRQFKQTTFSYDVLGGANLIRPELATKILG